MKQSEVMFAVAHDQPISEAEIAEFWDDPTAAVKSPLRACWRQGLLVRRKRKGGSVHRRQTYEYALASAEALCDTTEDTHE